MMAKKTAREKLAVKKEIKKVTLDKAWGGMAVGDTMLVSTPQEVDAFIRTIPSGQTTTVPELRASLAKQAACDGTCPLSTSIFVRMVAEAALEDIADGKQVSKVSPFWRVVAGTDKIAKKLDIDPDWIDQQRAMEAGA